MILFIDTTNSQAMEIGLKQGKEVLASIKIAVERTQAEKLLPEIAKLLKLNQLQLKDLESIEVNNDGGSFTSLRIGVATANALGFALGIPVQDMSGSAKKVGDISIVEPLYDQEPDIGSSSK
jgi:tRNA threonylcarbamoyladenosine biosynthesis protein TsaB